MKTKNLMRIAYFCAFISIFSQISMPFFIVPFTLQTFAIALTGYILGYKNAVKTILVYILLALCGMPVFASFKSGLSAFLSPTGGYILGFVFLSLFCGLNVKHKILFGLFGVLILHITGIMYFVFITKISDFKPLLTMTGVFIIKDIISVYLAYLISKTIKKSLMV